MKVLECNHESSREVAASAKFIETSSDLSPVYMTWCRKREKGVLAR